MFDFFKTCSFFHFVPFFWIDFELRFLNSRQYIYQVMNFKYGNFEDGESDKGFELLAD